MTLTSAAFSIPNNLPVRLTSFVGREREIGEVKRLLRLSRLLTLTGAGGSGKTRLALQVASDLLDDSYEYADYEDGAFFVSLAPISDSDLVIPTIAQTLNVRELPGQSIDESLKAYLCDRRVLLLLDNFEQMVEAAPHVVELLTAAPDLKVLVTSRASLRVSGEQLYPVQPLTLPDLKKLPELEALSEVEAVKLFVQRAASVNPHFTLTKENSQAITQICYRLDGLPLAIELAAARLNVLTPQAVLAKLKGRLELLTSGARDVPARHQTLRNAIEWSYNLLSEHEKKVFRCLGVFAGGCSLEAAEAICTAVEDASNSVLERLASLVDKSLLRSELGPEPEQEDQELDGLAGQRELRFTMLETIQEFSREKLQESGEAEALHMQHALYFMRLSEEAEPHLVGTTQQEWLARLEAEHDNFRIALRWAAAAGEGDRTEVGTTSASSSRTDKAVSLGSMAANGKAAALALDIGLRTAGALRQFWDVRSHYSEGREHLQRLLSAAYRLGSSREVRVKALNAAGVLTYRQGAYEAARSILEQALGVGREIADRQSMALSLHHLGNVALEQHEFTHARALYQESLALRKELRDKWGVAYCLNNLGCVASLQGDLDAAQSLFEESLALFREEGDKWGIAVPLIGLGSVAYLQGDYSAARSLYEGSLVISRETGSKLQIAIAIAALGGIVAATGEPLRGARLLSAADALLRKTSSVLETEDRMLYEAGVASARSQIGEEAFEKAMNQGRAMSVEEAIAYALNPALLPVDETPQSMHASKPSPGADRHYPEGLTRREVEVLRVVAQGLTNSQIAERLFLSPNTVNVHLYSIYSKLGVNSRTAAARFAYEHNLI